MPLFFSIAHVHHAIKDYFFEGTSLTVATVSAIFKLTYTEIFGIYAGLVYIRTGSLWAAFILHGHCNFFGFPHFWNLTDKRFKLTDKIIAGILYIGGIILFYKLFDILVKDDSPWWEATLEHELVQSKDELS